MTTIINHDIRSVNGKYLMMPPWKEAQAGWGNLAIPNVYLDGGDTAQQYPVNTYYRDFDRTHIYGYCYSRGNTDVKANIGLMNQGVLETVTWGTVAGAVGDTTVSILENTLSDEGDAEPNIFAGGYFMPRVNPYSCYRIISNTAHDGGAVGATEMDMVIEDGLTNIIAAGTGSCYLNRNQFVKMRHQWGGAAAYRLQVVGVTLIDPTASTWQWVQTWGPCHMPGDEKMGSANNLCVAWFHIDGGLIAGTGAEWSTTVQKQYAGDAIGDFSGGMTWHINLRLNR